MNIKRDKYAQLITELIIAIVFSFIISLICLSNFLTTPNNLYPGSTDFLGHMAKVEYVAKAIREGVLVSWYPHWYCGTAATQYYPPLSIYILALIHILAKNVMLTFKIFNVSMLTIGGVGVWCLCRQYIGKWVGLFGSLFYIAQPFIILTLLGQGQVAQGPIIALNPWYLVVLIQMLYNPKRKSFLLAVIICTLMILSHPNSIFMSAICLILSVSILVLYGRIKLYAIIVLGLSIVTAGLLTVFWSLVGVLQLENPTVPHVLGEAVKAFSATKEWFLNPNHFFYFSIAGQVGSLLAVILHLYIGKHIERQPSENTTFFLLGCLYIISAVFSFGLTLPLFRYLPLAESMVAGRILAFTAIPAAYFCSYAVRFLLHDLNYSSILQKGICHLGTAVLILIIIFDMNPLKYIHAVREINSSIELYDSDQEYAYFDHGRLTFFGPYDCSSTYFPVMLGFNMSEGYNIEGTPHNRAIWSESIAGASGCYDYLAKNAAYWNVRYFRARKNFGSIVLSLNQRYSFQLKGYEGENTEEAAMSGGYFRSQDPSYYNLLDRRNALVFGPGSPGVAMEFPYLVHDDRYNIMEYSLEELYRYKLIYICEPTIKTVKQKLDFEQRIHELLRRGVTIIIEPAVYQKMDIFGVRPMYYRSDERVGLRLDADGGLGKMLGETDLKFIDGAILAGLDKAEYRLAQDESVIDNAVIGTKKVDEGHITFIGMNFSHSLRAVYTMNFGVECASAESENQWTATKAFYDDMFGYFGVEKNFWPDAFPVGPIDWDYKGLSFTYDSDQEKEVTISVTYSPRWKITVDGQEVPYGQKEHLIVLTLPTGEHRVELLYGITIYGIGGYVISIISTILFLFFLVYYDIILQWIKGVVNRTKDVLEIAP